MLDSPDGLTPEEIAFREEAKAFATENIAPLARQIDQEEGRFCGPERSLSMPTTS